MGKKRRVERDLFVVNIGNTIHAFVASGGGYTLPALPFALLQSECPDLEVGEAIKAKLVIEMLD